MEPQKRRKSIFSATQLLLPGYIFTRLSILTLFLRLFKGQLNRFVCHVLIVFVVSQYVAFAVASLLQCTPVSFFWDKTANDGQGQCVNVEAFYCYSNALNMVPDFFLIITPIPQVWRLDISRGGKVGYTSIFLAQLIPLGASIIFQNEIQTHDDEVICPATSEPIISWLVIETTLYLVTACLPGLTPIHTLCSQRRQTTFTQGPTRNRSYRSRQVRGTTGMPGDLARLCDDNPTTPFDPLSTRSHARHDDEMPHGKGQVVSQGDPIPMQVWQEGILVEREVTLVWEENPDERTDNFLGF